MINDNTPNPDLIRAVAHVLDGETWEIVHRLTTTRVRPDGENQTVETTVLYNADHGWRLEAVSMDARMLQVDSNPSHDLEEVVRGARWEALDR